MFSSCSGGLSREVAVVVAHLFLFSQLGVLTRIGIDSILSARCGIVQKRRFGTCLTSLGLGKDPYGAYFPDLPSNALGSFVMGLAAASSTLSLGAPKPLAALPASHPWQSSPELHIGIRTGFCGCLTTFSSWSLALFMQVAGGSGRAGGKWQQWLWGWVVGLYVSLGSYAAGEHAARFLDDRLRPREEREAARADAQAARFAVETAPSIGVPWSGVVVSTSGVEGSDDEASDLEGQGALLGASLDSRNAARGVGASSSIDSSTAAPSSSGTRGSSRRRRWMIGGGGGVVEHVTAGGALSPPLTSPSDAAARAASRRLASRGEISLALTTIARHHASRAIETLARRSAVLEQMQSLRKESDRIKAQQQQRELAASQKKQRRRWREEKAAAEAAEAASKEALEATSRAAEAVERAEAIARGGGGAGGGADPSDLEEGRAPALAKTSTTSTATATTAATSPSHSRRDREAAAASLSPSSSSWRRPPPRAPSPEPASTTEVSISAADLAERARRRHREGTGGGGEGPASSDSFTSVAGSAGATPEQRPLVSRAASMLRGGYRAAARAAAGGADAEKYIEHYSFATKTNAAAVLVAAALWFSFLLLFVLDESKNPSASRRGEWLAVVLAPAGCLLRWRLATLNYKLPGKWRFLPAGTLVANVGGCLLTFTVAAVLSRRPPPSVWSAAVAKAMQVGIAGSLSTVSTLSAEVTAQLRRAPADARGYAYLGITWALAQVIGVVVYGTAVWSAPK